MMGKTITQRGLDDLIRLVLADIDGTLLPFGQWFIDDRTKEAIAELEGAGIAFGPASGRPVADITKAFRDPTYTSICVASDGMVVLSDGKPVVDQGLPNDRLQRIADVMQDTEWTCLGVCFNEQDNPTLPMIWASVRINDKAKDVLKPHIKYMSSVPNLESVPDHRVYVAGMFGPMDDSAEKDIAELVAERADGLHTMRTAPGYYDICLESRNKASGAKALIDHLGYRPDEVAFFGDSMNDISLFELFENSFCVECGAKEAKDKAGWVIPNPEDGGPVAVFRALAHNKGDLVAALEELGM